MRTHTHTQTHARAHTHTHTHTHTLSVSLTLTLSPCAVYLLGQYTFPFFQSLFALFLSLCLNCRLSLSVNHASDSSHGDIDLHITLTCYRKLPILSYFNFSWIQLEPFHNAQRPRYTEYEQHYQIMKKEIWKK